MRRKSILPALIIIVCAAGIVRYNGLFMRDAATQSPWAAAVNPFPYQAYFDLSNSRPNAVFATKLFPSYNEYCHTYLKLCQFIPWQQLYADFMRIGSIQYIGDNISKTSIEGVTTLLDTLTTLSPYRTYPYAFAELVVPEPKVSIPEETEETKALRKYTRTGAIALGEKWEFFLCDRRKIAAIKDLSQEAFVKAVYRKGERAAYENPCASYELPHYLAFNYFSYLGDAEAAGQQYMISAFHSNAPALTPLMAALVYGRGGEHLKSATLRYDRYLGLLAQNDEVLISEAERALHKAIFEIQLQIITEAAASSAECKKDYSCLQQNGAIKKSIEHNRTDICQSGKNKENLRCIVLAEGMSRDFITLAGGLVYPLGENYRFLWSSDYNSRWAVPH